MPEAQPQRIDLNRDVNRVRYRYLQLTKAEIVERMPVWSKRTRRYINNLLNFNSNCWSKITLSMVRIW